MEICNAQTSSKNMEKGFRQKIHRPLSLKDTDAFSWIGSADSSVSFF